MFVVYDQREDSVDYPAFVMPTNQTHFNGTRQASLGGGPGHSPLDPKKRAFVLTKV